MTFQARQTLKVIETGEIVPGLSFSTSKIERLKHVRLRLYVNGVIAGTERMRVRLYHDQALSIHFASSDWASVASIPDLPERWFGWLRFDFAPAKWLAPGQTYHLAVETDGYTRDGYTQYLALALDSGFGISGVGPALAWEPYTLRGVATA